jgi:hypothetical protein
VRKLRDFSQADLVSFGRFRHLKIFLVAQRHVGPPNWRAQHSNLFHPELQKVGSSMNCRAEAYIETFPSARENLLAMKVTGLYGVRYFSEGSDGEGDQRGRRVSG